MRLTRRQGQLLEFLQERSNASLEEMVRQLGVAEDAVRADLDRLDACGWIHRCGEAAKALLAPAVAERTIHGQSPRARIARRALEFVQDGETLFLDSGRTVSLFAEQLRAVRHLTVITNSPPVLGCLGTQPGTRVILVGGEYSDADRCCVGTMTEKELDGTYVSKVIMGADGIDIASAAVFARVRHFGYIQAVIRNAKQTVLLAESTKFDRIQGLRIVDLAHISTLVTDAGLSAGVRRAIEQMGIVLAIAA